jgi:hypothetical protein
MEIVFLALYLSVIGIGMAAFSVGLSLRKR